MINTRLYTALSNGLPSIFLLPYSFHFSFVYIYCNVFSSSHLLFVTFSYVLDYVILCHWFLIHLYFKMDFINLCFRWSVPPFLYLYLCEFVCLWFNYIMQFLFVNTFFKIIRNFFIFLFYVCFFLIIFHFMTFLFTQFAKIILICALIIS